MPRNLTTAARAAPAPEKHPTYNKARPNVEVMKTRPRFIIFSRTEFLRFLGCWRLVSSSLFSLSSPGSPCSLFSRWRFLLLHPLRRLGFWRFVASSLF